MTAAAAACARLGGCLGQSWCSYCGGPLGVAATSTQLVPLLSAASSPSPSPRWVCRPPRARWSDVAALVVAAAAAAVPLLTRCAAAVRSCTTSTRPRQETSTVTTTTTGAAATPTARHTHQAAHS